jgi:hypothetical protein
MNQPQAGKIRRDLRIFILYDSGLYAPKEIARIMRDAYPDITVHIVYHAVKRRKNNPGFYVKQFCEFVRSQQVDLKS